MARRSFSTAVHFRCVQTEGINCSISMVFDSPPAQEPQQMEWRGIYEFDGEFLRICYRWRRLPDGPVVDRPDSFKAVRGPGGTNSLKLRRVGD
jgi:hypothetical protein